MRSYTEKMTVSDVMDRLKDSGQIARETELGVQNQYVAYCNSLSKESEDLV